MCSICECEKSVRFYVLNTGARVLVILAAWFIPRGLNYAEMCACTACYQALTSSRSPKWPSGSTRNALLVDCETLILQSPPLTGAAKVQLSGGLALRTACRRLRDEHAQDGVRALDASLMSLNRSDRSGTWRVLPAVPGSDVSLSNRLLSVPIYTHYRLMLIVIMTQDWGFLLRRGLQDHTNHRRACWFARSSWRAGVSS